MVLLVPLSAIISLAVDWGHVQLVRSQMQDAADSIALGVMDAYISSGWTAATNAAVTYPSDNTVDPGSGVAPTVVVTGGSWNATTRSFTANVYTGTPAVCVVVSRTKAKGNALRIVWGSLIGINTVDSTVTAVAVLAGGNSGAFMVPSTANPYLAGMPPATTTIWGDNAATAAAYQVVCVPVVPGQWLSFSNFSGTSSILPGIVSSSDAAGNASLPLHHGQNYNSIPNQPGPENGIADAVLPADAVTGTFLGDDAPDQSAPPATVDWTQPAQANQPSYNHLSTKAPFLIGNGTTGSGVVKKFQVPPGATRLFLSVWDGVQQNNNSGSIAGSIQVRQYAKLVK